MFYDIFIRKLFTKDYLNKYKYGFRCIGNQDNEMKLY